MTDKTGQSHHKIEFVLALLALLSQTKLRMSVKCLKNSKSNVVDAVGAPSAPRVLESDLVDPRRKLNTKVSARIQNRQKEETQVEHTSISANAFFFRSFASSLTKVFVGMGMQKW